jgi:hypothetical protein
VSAGPPPIPYAATALHPPEVQEQLTKARLASKKLRRAIAVATFDAWMIAVFAGLSFVAGLLGKDISGMVIGAGMGVIAYVEFDGTSRIRRLDASAARRLAYNQLSFAGLLILYALWGLHGVSNDSTIKELQSYDAQFGDITSLVRTIWYAVYLGLIAVAIFAQGGTALYYYTREKYIHRYVQETAPWIIEMQRAGGSF